MIREEFEAIVIDALKELPEQFKDKLQNIEVVIEEEPDMGVVRTLGLGAKGRLLGLYQGVPLKNRTHYYGMVMPDKITIYKQNIEQACKLKKTSIREEGGIVKCCGLNYFQEHPSIQVKPLQVPLL